MFLIDSMDLYHFSIFWLLYGSFDTKKLTPEFCINIYSFKYWSILGLNIVIIEALEKKRGPISYHELFHITKCTMLARANLK